MNKGFLALIILAIFIIPTLTQAVIEKGTGSNVTSTITPQNPRPGSIVTITLEAYGFNIDKGYFKWRNNGQEASSGVGKKSYSFQLGSLGNPTKINVSLISGSRIVAEKSFYFEPADIDFIWEADSYVPTFYRGKARATAGSTLKIQAIPYVVTSSGVVKKSSDLDYAWRQDGVFLPESSGKGRDILTITTKPSDSQLKISLRVTSPDLISYVDKDLIINLDQPETIFYEKKPLSGLNYQKAIVDNYELYEEEVSFIGVPFFWPIKNVDELNYLWKVNSLEAQGAQNTNSLTVRQPDTEAGKNNISLEVTAKGNQTKTSRAQFNIQFGNNLLRLNNDQ